DQQATCMNTPHPLSLPGRPAREGCVSSLPVYPSERRAGRKGRFYFLPRAHRDTMNSIAVSRRGGSNMNVLDKFRVGGSRALIRGASRGLGRAMAQAFAEAGADLVLVGRDPDHLHQAQKDLQIQGRRVDVLGADLFEPRAVEKMCAT